MINFEYIKSLSIDELAEWLDKHGKFDTVPWSEWFSNKYCNNCESIKCKYTDAEETLGFSPYSYYNREIECAYCELEKKCRFFEELDDVPDNKEVIKLWLNEEVRNEIV